MVDNLGNDVFQSLLGTKSQNIEPIQNLVESKEIDPIETFRNQIP